MSLSPTRGQSQILLRNEQRNILKSKDESYENFGELDNETIPGLGAVLNDLLKDGDTQDQEALLRLYHILQQAS